MLTWPWKKKQLKVFANYPDLSISKFHFSISWFLVDESISLGSDASLQSFTVACFALWIITQDNEAGIVTFTLKFLLFSQSFVQILLCQRDVAVMFFCGSWLSLSFWKIVSLMSLHAQCTQSARALSREVFHDAQLSAILTRGLSTLKQQSRGSAAPQFKAVVVRWSLNDWGLLSSACAQPGHLARTHLLSRSHIDDHSQQTSCPMQWLKGLRNSSEKSNTDDLPMILVIWTQGSHRESIY